MGLADLQIQQLRRSKHWTERHRRMKQLRTATSTHNLHQFILVNPRTSTIINISDANGTAHQQIMDSKLWEATKVGDVEKFITCLEKFIKMKDLSLATTFSQLTDPDGDTFLHVAANYGHEELCGFIVHHFRSLITCKNYKSDFALHLAARGGHLGVVDIILSFHQDSLYHDSNWDDCMVLTDEECVALVKHRLEEKVLVNEEGNTALHEALLNDHKDIAEYLIINNVEAAYYVNKEGKSPLYMAVAAGNTEYVNTILNGESEHMHLLHEKLVQGKSLPHAAIMGRNLGTSCYIDFTVLSSAQMLNRL